MKGPFQSLLPGLFYWDHFKQQQSVSNPFACVPLERMLLKSMFGCMDANELPALYRHLFLLLYDCF
jgi:hypothetical protein